MKNKEMMMPAGVVGDKGVRKVVNLRPELSADGKVVLRPAMLPPGMTLPKGWKALAKRKGKLLINNANTLATFYEGFTTPGQKMLPGEARCSIAAGERELVMCEEGAVYASVDEGAPQISEAWPDFPAINLQAVDATEFTASVDIRTLSRPYTTGLFDKKDRDALIADLSGAYCRMCADAAASGVMIQPALARYRLLDRRGNEIFISPPVMLMHSSGAQCCQSQSLTSSDRQTVGAYTLRAYTWYPRLVIPAYSNDDVAQAEILMTPLFQPYDGGSTGTAHLGRAASSTTTFATVSLPGRERGLGHTYAGNAKRIVMEAIARIDKLESRVAVVTRPFDGNAHTMTLTVSVEPDPTRDAAKIRTVLSAAAKGHTYADVMLRRPHTFSAGVVAESSGAVAWGALKAIRYKGFPFDTFTTGTTGTTRTTVCAVRFSDGKGVTRTEASTAGPVKLGPVLCYPAPDAVEMTIISNYNGSNHMRTFPLTADASGRYAVYVADSLQPFELTAIGTSTSVSLEQGDISFADMIGYAPVTRPLDIVVTQSAASEVMALAGRPGSDQSWDFGRSRFSVGCRGAIYSTGVNLATGGTGMRTVLGRGVDRADAIAVGNDGEVFVAGAGLTLLPRSGSHVKVSDNDAYVAVGYDRSRDELWALRDDGGADVFCRRFGWGYFSVEGFTADTFDDFDGLHLCNGRTIYDVSESGDGTCPVILTMGAAADSRHGFFGLKRLYVVAQGSSVSGMVDITGTSVGDLRQWLIRRAKIRGALAGPLAIGLLSRPARAVEVNLDATVSDDFVISGFMGLRG